jgi:hypothetical protein
MSDSEIYQPPKSLWEQAKEARIARQVELQLIQVELQVKDTEHAKSPEVIAFCVQYLVAGVHWEVLRRKLGLGPAHSDPRWRTVRKAVNENLLPKSDEEALLAQSNVRGYLLDKIGDYIDDVEAMIAHTPNSEEGLKLLPQFMKLRLDGLKTLLEENKISFDAYVAIKKAKALDLSTQGASVIIQNNFHINRPGSTPREVVEVTKKAANLAQKIGGLPGTSHPSK